MNTYGPNLLLIPSSLYQTESLRAFMYRAAKANAFPRMYAGQALAPEMVCQFLGLLESRNPKLSHELYRQLGPIPTTGRRASVFLLGEEQIPASCVRVYARSLCPLCLSSSHWSRGEWELRAYTTCHVHGVRLLDKCDQCNRKLSWDRTELSTCYCGRELSMAIPLRAQDWERRWARPLHLAFRFSINCSSLGHPSRNRIPEIELSKLLLMVDIVRTVLIPRNGLGIYSSSNPSLLSAMMLEDPRYLSRLWRAISLHAAETPMLLSKMLLPGQSNDDLIRNYEGLFEDLPIPLALQSHSSPNSYTSSTKVAVKVDIRSHVARLKQLYGGRSDASFDPFEMSRAA